MPVVVCFDAGNLETVVAETSALLPADVVRVLGVDDDQYHVERALGFLSEKLGLSPHVPVHGGESVLVAKGTAGGLRPVSIGEAVADGQWHQGARGSYCMTLHRDDGSEAVRSIVVELLPTGIEKKMSATFLNCGMEAGRVAMRSIEADRKTNPTLQGVRAMMVAPEFKSLAGHPTDWNDLVKIEGPAAVRAVLQSQGVPGGKVARVVDVERDVGRHVGMSR